MKKNESLNDQSEKNEMRKTPDTMMVQMLGGFSVSYGGKDITFGKNRVSKSMQLLQLLLYKKDEGIPRVDVLELLYGRGGLSDPSNNLRVAVHRLKKMLLGSGLPENEYFKVEDGVFRWCSSFPVCVDVLEFARLIEEAGKQTDEEERMRILESAIGWYRGDFLPKLSGEDWVILETVHYKKEYEDALTDVLKYFRRRHMFSDMLRMAAEAGSIYPFDEWQTYKIDALIGMGREEEAYKVYEDTSKLLVEELDVQPSSKMAERLRKISGRLTNIPEAITDIKGGLLQEKGEESGAYYCSLPSFIDEYRLIRRMGERSGQSVYLMLCTITDGKGNPLGNGEKLTQMSAALKETIRQSLRKGDSYTQYSMNQFLILLVGAREEHSQLIAERITKRFSEKHKYWKNCVDYFATSAIDSEVEGKNISFKNENS